MPYAITHPGGASEHWNAEPGALWLPRALDHWPSALWISPVLEVHCGLTSAIGMIRQLMADAMVPLTLDGPTHGIRLLGA